MYFRLAVIFQMYSENSDNNIATIWYVTQLRLCCLLETFKTYFNPKVNKFKSCQQRKKKNHCLQAKLVENCTSKVLAFSFQKERKKVRNNTKLNIDTSYNIQKTVKFITHCSHGHLISQLQYCLGKSPHFFG